MVYFKDIYNFQRFQWGTTFSRGPTFSIGGPIVDYTVNL